MRCTSCQRFAKDTICDTCEIRLEISAPGIRPKLGMFLLYQMFLDKFPRLAYLMEDMPSWFHHYGLFFLEMQVVETAMINQIGIQFHYIIDYSEDGEVTVAIGHRGREIQAPMEYCSETGTNRLRRRIKHRSNRTIAVITPIIHDSHFLRQTHFVETHGGGNCLPACIASLLKLDIPDIPLVPYPKFTKRQEREGWRALKNWLRDQGYILVDVAQLDDSSLFFQKCGYHIMSGTSPRGIPHAVIAKNGKPIFDPHPSDGMISPPYLCGFLVRMEIK